MAKEKDTKKDAKAAGGAGAKKDAGKAAPAGGGFKEKLQKNLDKVLKFIEKKMNYIAIDIGTKTIKIVEVDKNTSNDEKLWIKKFIISETPAESIDVTDLENPIKDVKGIAATINRLIKKSGIKPKNVFLSIPDNLVEFTWVNIPEKNFDNIEKEIETKVKDKLGDMFNLFYYDYQVVEKRKDQYAVLIEIIFASHIHKFVEIMEFANLNTLAINSGAINVLNVFHNYLSSKAVENQNIGIVHMGSDATVVNIYRNGVLKINKNLEFGSNEFDKLLMTTLRISFDQALDMKKNEEFFLEDPNKGEQNKIQNYLYIKPAFGKLIKGVYEVVEKYLAKFREFKLHKLYLVSGGANFKNMSKLIKKHINIDIETGIKELNINSDLDITDDDKNILLPALGSLINKLTENQEDKAE